MESLPTPQEFYLEIALYRSFHIDDFNITEIKKLIFYKGSLDSYCIGCGKESIFVNHPINNITQIEVNMQLSSMPHPPNSGSQYHTVARANEEYFDKNTTFEKEFQCQRNNEHVLKFSLFVTNNSLQKYGQYPSFADLNSNKFSEYKKILGNNFKDLNTAINLYSHDIGSGSYVYLRRIVENFIVQRAYEKAKLKPEWDESKYNNSRFKEKLKLLSDELPRFIQENSSIYSLLSQGIHELDEKECIDNFKLLLNCIEYILFEIKSMADREVLSKNLSNKINGFQIKD